MNNGIGMSEIMIQSAQLKKKKNKKYLTNYNGKNFKVASFLETW